MSTPPAPNNPDAFPNVFVTSLARSLTSGGSETEIYVSTIYTLSGEIVTTADISSWLGECILSVDVQSASRIEFISATGVSSTDVAFTGATRGLSFKNKTVISANKKFHAVGAPVIIAWGTQNIIDMETMINDNYNTLVNYINSVVVTGGVPATDSVPGIGFDGDQAEIDGGLGSKVYTPTGLPYPVFVDGATLKQWAIDLAIPTALPLVAGVNILKGQPVFPGDITSNPIVFDNSDSGQAVVNSGNTPYSFSKPYILGTGVNGYMVFGMDTGEANSTHIAVSVPNYAGNAMTLLQSDSTGGVHRYFYGMSTVGIAPGAHNITFTVSNGGFNNACAIYEVATYFNVDSTSIVSAKAQGVASMTINTVNADSVVWGFSGLVVNEGSPGTKAWTSANLVDNFRNDQEAYFDGSTSVFVAAGNTALIASPSTVTVSVAGGLSSPGTPDIMFAVAMTPYGSTIHGGAFLTDAVSNYATFIGFALNDALQGQPVMIQTAVGSLIGGFSGLTPNSIYYLNDTAGTIGTSPGSNTVVCGVAISATTLLMANSALNG